MLHMFLNILMWFFIAILILVVGFWLYAMIVSKEFRDVNIDGWKEAQRERERKRAARKSIERKRFDKYYKTGNLRYLYDDDFEG